MSYTGIMKGMVREWLFGVVFHTLMAILLITGLIIDLLGPWLGGSLLSIRSIAHGYVGAVFVLVFIVGVIGLAFWKPMRMVMTVTNYVDYLFYAILIVTGVTTASQNKPWIDIIPGLSATLSPMAPNAPAVHALITYSWIVFSTVFPGGFLHGLASAYLVSHLKKRPKTMRRRER